MKVMGGNEVRELGKLEIGKTILATSPYSYYLVKLEKGDTYEEKELKSLTVFTYLVSGKIICNDDFLLKKNHIVRLENTTFRIQCRSGNGILLVAGVGVNSSGKSLDITALQDAKRVNKPWGYEIWLNGEGYKFAFKNIFLKSGSRTSLQYHVKKRETNLLIKGDARLHFSKSHKLGLDDISHVDINSYAVVDVFPMTVHRIEALSDISLFEVSTPELDDVVRIADDSGREDGRIEAEHQR